MTKITVIVRQLLVKSSASTVQRVIFISNMWWIMFGTVAYIWSSYYEVIFEHELWEKQKKGTHTHTCIYNGLASQKKKVEEWNGSGETTRTAAFVIIAVVRCWCFDRSFIFMFFFFVFVECALNEYLFNAKITYIHGHFCGY